MGIIHFVGLTALVLIAGMIGLMAVSDKYKSGLALWIVVLNALISSIPSVLALSGNSQIGEIMMPHLLGKVSIVVDSLSAWFILIINFTAINGVLYGKGYLKSYTHLKTNRELHWIFYILFHISMIWVCVFENGLAFLISWELMSLSSLMLVIFEYHHNETLKAGINYMVQMHLSVVFLSIGFIWLFASTGSFNFSALAQLPAGNATWIFVLLFFGFSIKAGFIPFHTWLPHAHPAAPSHISGVMSGVIVKLGIYGILRIISYLRHDYFIAGEILLGLSVITALYGISNAAVRHDFKAMLAFCTIENIGIIGIGMGLGLIGLGIGNTALVILGFCATLLHTLNHSLFKSLLFFSAGSVYKQTHTRNIEHLGGLVKKMPITSAFFLIGALAISGLPPFNGFISEYLIYSGLFKGLSNLNGVSQVFLLILSIAGLAIVGGISLLTFTKTFGVIFLGNPRKEHHHEPEEVSFMMHLPQYFILLAMLSVAIFPQFYFQYAIKVVDSIFKLNISENIASSAAINQNLAIIGRLSFIFISLLFILIVLRYLILRKRENTKYETWGCGYVAPIEKAQYTGRSFSRTYGELFSFMVKERKDFKKLSKEKIYPGALNFTSNYFDAIEKYLILPITRRLNFSLNYFNFIQNGQIQSYVIYGLVFIMIVFIGTVLQFII